MPITINGTGTITGISAGGLPDAIITTAEIVDANVTQAKLDTAVQPIGVNQTWQNVTGSRANGVTYTNTTGRPITIAVSASSSSGSGNLYISGVSVFLALCRSTYFNFVPIYAVVPPGGTYAITGFDYYTYWTELR